MNCKEVRGLKKSRRFLLLGASAVVLMASMPAYAIDADALPSGGEVVGGSANFDYSTANELHINQHSDRVVIDWESFNIGSDALTEFHQNSSNALAVNRVTGEGLDPTQILGQLKANGRVLVLDRNGVIFGEGAVVDVGAIVVSTGDVDTNAIMGGGNITIENIEGGGFILNEGSINVSEAGLAAFVAPTVVNNGIINARLGRVQIGAGSQATIDLYGDGLMELELDAGTQQTLINNGIILVEGGSVQIQAAAAKDIVDNLIINTGIISADSVGTDANGNITLYAEGGTTYNDGYISAAGYDEGESGGNIEILGENVILDNNTLLDASGDVGGGDIKIGGDYLGTGDTPTAKYTYVAGGALILNDAITNGDGGRTIVWSDDTTEFYGSIYGRGGALGGNGGFVETSGKENLLAQGYVDLTATNGNKGTYLLDPDNITIMKSGSLIDSLDDMTGLTSGIYTIEADDQTFDAYVDNDAGDIWLLVGRGRENWEFDGDGEGGAATVTNGLGTSAAFDPKSYSTDFINDLIGNTGIDLTDTTIKLKRAANVAGTEYQNVHWQSLAETQWTWDFDGSSYNVSVDMGASVLGGAFVDPSADTRDTYTGAGIKAGNNYQRTWTWGWGGKGSIQGFSYGSSVQGVNNNDPNTFLWENGSEGHATPYTEVYLKLDDLMDATSPGPSSTFTTRYLEQLSTTADVILQANDSITLDLQGDNLALSAGRNISLQTTTGDINVSSAGTITTGLGNVTFTTGGAGNINVNAALTLNAVGGGDLTFTSGGVTNNVGNVTVTEGTRLGDLYIAPSQDSAPIPPSVDNVISNPSGQVNGSAESQDSELKEQNTKTEDSEFTSAAADCLISMRGRGCVVQ